jgi:hypothetical protein
MYHGDSCPEDQATDTAMAALYRQLDNHDLSTDTPFDAQAGLQRLTDRIHHELGQESQPPAPPGHPRTLTGQEPASPGPRRLRYSSRWVDLIAFLAVLALGGVLITLGRFTAAYSVTTGVTIAVALHGVWTGLRSPKETQVASKPGRDRDEDAP